jgi:peptidoglycan-N-acetylglucosamine deacetylase
MAHSDQLNALSFDIEDWFHLVEIDAVADTDLWPSFPSLVERETNWILDLLEERRVRATFFVLGWVADRYPSLIRRIADCGHEVGSHSYWHRRVYELSPEEFREDLERSIDAIERASGQRVRGFRAPSFSITPGTEWALDELLDLGLEYDASLFPASRGHGGYPCLQRPHEFTTPTGRKIPELPMSVAQLRGVGVPFTGGGYLRLLPTRAIELGFAWLHRRDLPAVVYLHPRDFAKDCPRVSMPLHRRFKSYVGLGTPRAKLRRLLDRYRFDTCAAVLRLNEPG